MAARKRKSRAKRKEQAPGWAWMLFGLSIGLTVALVVYLRSGEPEFRPQARPTAAVTTAPTATETAPPASERTPAATPSEAAGGSATPPAAAADDNPATAFGFYDELGELEVNLPASERLAERKPTVYTLQAGSFRTFDEADRRQARIALLGIESRIETAIVGDAIWFRVIVGPLSERGEINRTLRLLDDARIETMRKEVAAE